jgi:hypothetical protein
MLKSLAERRQLCKEQMEHPSPTLSPCQSADEDDGDKGDESD